MIVLIGVTTGLILMGCSVVLLQNKMIYFPSRYPASFRPGEGALAGFHPYTTADGRKQWGFLIEPAKRAEADSGAETGDRASGRGEGPEFYLVFYGNASSAMGEADFYEGLARRTGRGFFIVDYRGYGFNDGKPSEEGLVADALGAYDTLKAEGRFERGVGVIGQSLGGGVAFALAVERPVDRLVTISAFTSIDDMARIAVVWPLYHFAWNHFPNDARLKELLGRPPDRRPARITLFHGRRDEVIPFWMGERLAATPGEGLTFHPVERAMHNDIPSYILDDLAAAIVEPQ
jgi:hypothetical protein